jgi:hypothetical protein
MDEFVIDFVYDHMPFTGLVSPRQEGNEWIYTVRVESQQIPVAMAGWNGALRVKPAKRELMTPSCYRR